MTIRWRLSAITDLRNIHDFIAEHNPAAAAAVTRRVLRSVERLEQFPESGRRGQVTGTREVIVPGLPYIVVYTADDRGVDVIAVFHVARDR
jgi:addiction module RelE/StbE family toxin